MNAKTRLWVVAAAVVCVGVVLTGIFGGLMPQLVTARATADIARNIEATNIELSDQIAELESAAGGSSALEEEYAELVSAVPISADSAGFLAELQQMQNVSGARITALELEAMPSAPATEGGASAKPMGGVVGISMYLEASGTQQQVADFVRSLQVGPRFVLVNDVEISDTAGASIAQVSGSLYSLDR